MSKFPESIFYSPRYRDENALSYAFLALVERLDRGIRNTIFTDCNINELGLKSDFYTVFQYILRDGSKPDGILIDDTKVILFENKVDQTHTSEQLSRYYKQLKSDFKELDKYLLVGVDSSIQSRLVTKSILDEAKIPDDSVFILVWQELHLTCEKLLKEAKDKMREVDLFLLEEFRTLLEEMSMIPYTKLTSDDLKGFDKTRNQLSILQEHLNQEIPRLLPQLQLYNRRNSFANLFADLLGFQFKGASDDNYSFVYLAMNHTDDTWEVGIAIFEENDRKKLMKKMDFKKLIDEFEKTGTYHLKCGYEGRIEVEPPDVGKFLVEKNEQLEEHFEIYRAISYENLESEYGLKTSEFPERITEEILNLRGFVEIIGSILQTE